MINRVTGERIRNELALCLEEPKRSEMLARLAELGVLKRIHPDLIWRPATSHKLNNAQEILKDPMQDSLWVVLDLLIDAHTQIAPKSLYAGQYCEIFCHPAFVASICI